MALHMKVKVCGIRRLEDALVAVDAGAWALGFIFHRPSPRYIAPEEAAKIIERLPGHVLTVGVFVDYSIDELNDVVSRAGLGAAQLHGAETPEYARQVEASTVIKAFRVSDEFDISSLEPYEDCRILLDTYRAGQAGGTGETFDWEIARRVGEKTPVILAGGLDPDNVREAIRIARPVGVDVSSGVETAPGVKSAAAIRRLFEAVGGRG
jgi:phosphoribosylanthranilate isomerase